MGGFSLVVETSRTPPGRITLTWRANSQIYNSHPKCDTQVEQCKRHGDRGTGSHIVMNHLCVLSRRTQHLNYGPPFVPLWSAPQLLIFHLSLCSIILLNYRSTIYDRLFQSTSKAHSPLDVHIPKLAMFSRHFLRHRVEASDIWKEDDLLGGKT